MKLGRLLVGLGIGAVVGALLAPKSGEELRTDLKETLSDGYDTIKGMTKEDVEAKVGETIENIKKAIDEFDQQEFEQKAKEKLVELENKLKELSESVKKSDEYAFVSAKFEDITNKANEALKDVMASIKEDTLDEEELEELKTEIDDVEKEIEELKDEVDE